VSATVTSDPGTTACPRCGAAVAAEQDWCLRCGDAARTRLVPTPNWRWPIALTALVATLAALAIALAFVELTRDPPPAATTTAPATTPPPATAAPTTTVAPTATTAPTDSAPTATTPTTSTPTSPAEPGATSTTP
jgi:hypothetical protein